MICSRNAGVIAWEMTIALSSTTTDWHHAWARNFRFRASSPPASNARAIAISSSSTTSARREAAVPRKPSLKDLSPEPLPTSVACIHAECGLPMALRARRQPPWCKQDRSGFYSSPGLGPDRLKTLLSRERIQEAENSTAIEPAGKVKGSAGATAVARRCCGRRGGAGGRILFRRRNSSRDNGR